MKRFILEQSETEFYTSHSGLALVGLCLNRYGQLNQALEKGIPLRHGISHADIIKSYMGTLCLGKSDFEAIENHRDDNYFKAALALHQVPSSARLRQRLDEHADALLPIIYQSNINFLVHAQVPVTPLATGHVALDIDVYPMNNEKTSKEGVSRTYKGFDGYLCPVGTPRLPCIWAKRGGASATNCAKASSIANTNSAIRWSVASPPRNV